MNTQWFDAQATLFCGQCFSWHDMGGECYTAAIGGRAVLLRRHGQGYELITSQPDEDMWWARYFDMDCDYPAIALSYADHPVIARVFEFCHGLRLLNQPVWETLCAFIISANNHVARIRQCYSQLAQTLGELAYIGGHTVYHFPPPERIAMADEAALRALGLGYRAPLLLATARTVAQGGINLYALASLTYDQAVKSLIALPGVGPKVAACVLLYSCSHRGAFPVDVWMEKVMQHLYGPFPGGRPAAARLGQELFGQHAGIVQQALFHAARTGMLELPTKK